MTQYFKTAILTAALAGFLGLPRIAVAQDAKIATVDIQTLTLMSDAGKAANDQLEKRFQAISAEMEKARKDIEDKETSLRTRERLMSAAAKASATKEIEDDKIRFDRKNQDYQNEMAEMQNRLLGPVSEKVIEQLNAYVKEKAYTILIDLSAEGGNVVWANPRNDITPDVMKRMNDDFKKSGGAAAAKPAAPAGATAAPAATPIPPVPAAPRD